MENINIKARKWGDSIAIVIPSEIVKREGIKANDDISVKIEKKNDLSALFGSLKGWKINSQKLKDEIRKEEWEKERLEEKERRK